MFFNAQIVLAFSALALFVNAQSSDSSSTASAAVPSSTASISPCILNCVTGAATTAGCSSFSDLQCVCTNTAFQSAAAACLQSTCTAEDQAAAVQLQQSECATAFPTTASGSATVSTVSSVSSSAATSKSSSSTSRAATSGASTPTSPTSSTSGAAAATSTKANSASGLKFGFADGSLVGAVLTLGGALAGALLVL